ncbi:MAG: ribonuclease HII [Bryobacter sp.]
MPRPPICSLRHENRLRALGYVSIAGVDEAGRGCIFGPVYAAAVILRPQADLAGIRDSKLVPEDERTVLAAKVKQAALAFAVAHSTVEEIERINILEASRLAMRRAVEALSPPPDYLLVDYLRLHSPLPQTGLVKGDSQSKSIAAASLLAKTARDEKLRELSQTFPVFHLDANKGYGTPDHLAALRRFGPTPFHRRTFAPVRSILEPGLFSA